MNTQQGREDGTKAWQDEVKEGLNNAHWPGHDWNLDDESEQFSIILVNHFHLIDHITLSKLLCLLQLGLAQLGAAEVASSASVVVTSVLVKLLVTVGSVVSGQAAVVGATSRAGILLLLLVGVIVRHLLFIIFFE